MQQPQWCGIKRFCKFSKLLTKEICRRCLYNANSHIKVYVGDARRLTLGCKLQILVSLRVFGMESHYIGPFRYLLVLSIKKFTKNVLTDSTEIFLRGQFKLEPHPDWSPLGFNLNFPTRIPVTFIWEFPPPLSLHPVPGV